MGTKTTMTPRPHDDTAERRTPSLLPTRNSVFTEYNHFQIHLRPGRKQKVGEIDVNVTDEMTVSIFM